MMRSEVIPSRNAANVSNTNVRSIVSFDIYAGFVNYSLKVFGPRRVQAFPCSSVAIVMTGAGARRTELQRRNICMSRPISKIGSIDDMEGGK